MEKQNHYEAPIIELFSIIVEDSILSNTDYSSLGIQTPSGEMTDYEWGN